MVTTIIGVAVGVAGITFATVAWMAGSRREAIKKASAAAYVEGVRQKVPDNVRRLKPKGPDSKA